MARQDSAGWLLMASSVAVAVFMLSALGQASAQQNLAMNTNSNANANSTGAATTIPNTSVTPSLTASNAIIVPTNFLRVNVTKIDPLAVCNDGSPGFYYFRPGTGAGATKWVIRLEGGGWCYDQQTCTLRYSSTPNLMGSQSQYYPDILGGSAVAGVLEGDPRANPYMYTWNHVSIGYCTSDSYLGNAGPGDTTETGVFQYRGQRVVNASITSLLANQNLGQATDILLDGVSAGAVGVFNLADPIYSIIHPKAPLLVNYKALVDAGWFMDLPSYSIAASAFTFRKTAQGLLNNFKAAYDPDCVAAYPSQAWACFFAQYAWAYIKTPLIFHEYLYDSANLGYDAAGSQNNYEDFRSKLTSAITTTANSIGAVSNQTTGPTPKSSVTTQSLLVQPPVSASGLPVLPPNVPSSTNTTGSTATGLYAPGMQNLPPSALPRSLPPGTASPPSAPPSAAAGAMQTTNSTGLPGAKGPIGTAAMPAVFAPACGNHDVTDNSLFEVSHIGNVQFTDILNQWFTTGQGTLPYVDPTVGLGSAAACLQALGTTG